MQCCCINLLMSPSFLLRKLRSVELNQVLVNLCLSLTGLYITFIISALDEVKRIHPLCAAVGALLHYFFLSTFLLMAVDAVLIFKKFAFPMKRDFPNYVATGGAISWSTLLQLIESPFILSLAIHPPTHVCSCALT